MKLRPPIWTSMSLNTQGNRRMVIRLRYWPGQVHHRGKWEDMKPAPAVEGLMEKTKIPKERWIR